MLSAIKDFYDQQSTTSSWKALLPDLRTYIKAHRPEAHTEEGLSRIITTSQRRATAILRERKTTDELREAMRELEEKTASKRMTASRKAKWEEKNKHIISAFNELKEEDISRLDEEYLALHEALQKMKERGREMTKRKQEEKEEAKATKRQKREINREAKKADKERVKTENKEKKKRENKEREERNAQLRAKAAGELLDMKAAKLKKTQQTEKDMERRRKLENAALRVFRQLENTLPPAPPTPSSSEGEDDEENKENIN
jgi:hypothetical protein